MGKSNMDQADLDKLVTLARHAADWLQRLRDSNNPEVLREVFDASPNVPYLITALKTATDEYWK